MRTEDSNISRDLKPSQELLKKIAEVKDSLTTAGKMIKEAYDLAIRDGFSPIEARQFLTAQLPFLAERTIRLALPAEAKDKSKDHSDAPRHTLPRNHEPKEPNVVNITTKAKIEDADLVKKDPPPEDDQEEEPTELELAQIKIQQLQDALKKTEQFKAAFEVKPNITNATLSEQTVFDWLAKREDGVGRFWYDNYGIDLVPSRLIAQLKNQGVKVFKRLYFEV